MAKKLNLIDLPDGKRKIHSNPTPLLGGLIVLFNIFLFSLIAASSNFFELRSFFLLNNNLEFFVFFLGCCFVFAIGFVDDRQNLSPNLKFLLLSCSILLLLFFDQTLLIKEINLTFSLKRNIGVYSYPWTLICFLLFLNAVNMFDGINSQVTLYSIFFLIYLSITTSYTLLCICLIVGLLFFLLKNFNGKAFLGDSGSYLLAFILAYLSIKSYNKGDIVFADEIVLLMAVPGIDLMRLFVCRILKKRHPFSPDREHLHHYLLKKFNKVKTILIIQSIIWVHFFVGYFYKNLILYLLISVVFAYGFIIFKIKNNEKDTIHH